jgi:hypothetical protein
VVLVVLAISPGLRVAVGLVLELGELGQIV